MIYLRITHPSLFQAPFVVAAASVVMVGAACGASSSQSTQPAIEHAAFQERTRCDPDDDKMLMPVLGGAAVTGVQPLYNNVGSAKSGPQSELRGAIISVSALPGMTAEWLDRALECHDAKITLGHAPALPGDPFWLPGATVDVDVRPARDGFDVAVAGYSTDEARQILDRASAFVKAKASQAPPKP